MDRDSRSNPIRASELGEYVFCARAWRLRADGYKPTLGHESRAAGERWHINHGRSVRRAARLRRLSTISAYSALIVAVLMLFWWWK